MGYATDYELSIHDPQPATAVVEGHRCHCDTELLEDAFRKLEKIAEDDLLEYDEYRNTIRSVDECKWYDHDEHLIELSKSFPGVTFMLHGEGEETGDLWNTYYRDGKLQHCVGEVTYAPFDPSKLIGLKGRK